MKKLLFSLNLMLTIPFIAMSQTGSIKGVIIDSASNESLIGATILLDETLKGTISDLDGNYIISNVQTGTYNIVCSYVSYKTMIIRNIRIDENQEVIINFNISESLASIDEVKVTARKRRENEQYLLLERKKASIASESIGNQELSRKGAANVSEGVRKISGISMIGDKQLFARGLGDRYNSVQLNGLPIASPDPTKKIIRLDIFPTKIVDALSVSKVFVVDNYADYTGALIDIASRQYPTEPFLEIKAGAGYNTTSTGKELKQLSYSGNGYAGLNLSARRSSVSSDAKRYNLTDTYNYDLFETDMSYTSKRALPNHAIALSTGKMFTIKRRQLGVLFSTQLDNEAQLLPQAKEVILRSDGTNQSRFTTDAYRYSTNFSNLLNISYRHNADNYVNYNFLFFRNTLDRFSEKNGRTYDDDVFVRYGEFTSHTLINNQLFGNHSLSDKWNTEWGVGYALASSETPDTRQLVLQPRSSGQYTYFDLNAQETMRKVSELNEHELTGKLKFNYKIKNLGIITFGAQTRLKNRNYDAYLFYYNVRGISEVETNREDAHLVLNDENFANESIWVKNGSIYENKYDASLSIIAAYTNYLHRFNKLTVNIGVRAEFSNLEITPYEAGYARKPVKLSSNDFFPAIHFKYTNTDKSNIRLSVSRTITRPGFNEKSPSKLVPEYGKPLEHGNPDLLNSYSHNIDIRFEIFPRPQELISIGVYGKQIQDPIERVARKSGGNNIYTYQNTNEGIAAGVELELKKTIRNLYAGFNAAYIYTQIKIPESSVETNKTRALQGASPYLINADLGYIFRYGNEDKHASSIALVYNVYGPRIWSVGADGIGDSYELPYNTLNLVIRNKLFNRLEIDFAIKNLLDEAMVLEQDYYDSGNNIAGRKSILEIKPGIEFKFSIGYKF